MRRAVCPGSFDPVTNGHLDVIGRAASLFDAVTVAVLVNEAKQTVFTIDERIEMLTEAVAGWDNVEVASFEGLLVDFCVAHQAASIVKGVRVAADFDYEVSMAHMNGRLARVETVFLPARPEWAFVASSLVKEVVRFGGDVAGLVPSNVLTRLQQRLTADPTGAAPGSARAEQHR